MSILFIFLFLLSLLLSKSILGSIFTPFVVYSGAWSIAGFLLGLHWISYPDVGSVGWLGIALAWFAIFIGSCLGSLVKTKSSKFTYRLSEKRLYKAMMFTNLFVAIGLIWKVKILMTTFGSLSNVNLTALRAMIVTNTLVYPSLSSYMTSLSLGGVALAMVYFFNYGLAKGAIFIPLILVIISDWTYAGRAGLFTAACLVLASFIIYRSIGIKKRLNISKRSKLIMIVLSVGMLLIFSFVILSNREGNTEQYAQFKNASAIAYIPSLNGLYTYYTSNIVSLGVALSNPLPMDGGSLLFAPVLNVLYKFIGEASIVQYYPFVYIPAAINTYTYLYEFYRGFGWTGIVLGPFILGFLSQRYLEIFKKGGLYATIPLIFLTTALGFSVPSNNFAHASFDIALVYGVIMLKWATTRTKEL
ncbi:hypothetical protein BSK49_00965 [Paenibacillus odorifer]|uniref:O-antigen polymerase n=1 Tax=Paenibacillus odorifer TaxID=189426 RepID=UPI00096E1815|nr:O-antigen polymerase [Paenibacillus odorifer]OMD92986.1 hypothetical protein BSK49_00965 [Paenibacillus odorifer]